MARAPQKVAAWMDGAGCTLSLGEGRRAGLLCNLVSQSRCCPKGLLVKLCLFPKSREEKEVITVENNSQYTWLLGIMKPSLCIPVSGPFHLLTLQTQVPFPILPASRVGSSARSSHCTSCNGGPAFHASSIWLSWFSPHSLSEWRSSQERHHSPCPQAGCP